MLAALTSVLLAIAGPGAGERLVDLVRPIVGTARKDQRIGAVNSGQTYPATGVPFGMTHWTPQTQASEDKCVSPFYAQDERIQGIRASHWWSGSCTHDYGSVTIAAIAGPLRPGAEERASSFSRAEEVMTPAYYAVTLADHGVRVEVTGTARAGVLRFTFLRGGEASLLVHANRKTQGAVPGGLARVDAARGTIAVSNPVQRIYAGSGRPGRVLRPPGRPGRGPLRRGGDVGRDRSARRERPSNRARATSSGPTPASGFGPGRS